MLAAPILSVIIPASNEAAWIEACLVAVFASDPLPGGAEVIVVANGCQDRTADLARQMAVPKGWQLRVIERAEGSKPLALNAGDHAAQAPLRAYLDADCTIAPDLLPLVVAALEGAAPCYVGATPKIPRAASRLTRAYAGFWKVIPFNRLVAPGYGFYSVNTAGRALWGDFPDLIADDSFVRLQFLPEQRQQVSACYHWPMAEGFRALVRVRRRQDRGMRELASKFPMLMQREAKPKLTPIALGGLAVKKPLGFLVYALVTLSVRIGRNAAGFTRGR